MNKKIISLVIMVLTVVLFSAASVGVNLFTGPIIEKKNAGKALGVLTEVLPEGTSFELIHDGKTVSLNDINAIVTEIYKESNGKGFVFKTSNTSIYSKSPLELIVGVTADGKIAKVKVANYAETKPISDSFVQSFEGKDSALAGVEIQAEVTYTSNAFKEAIAAGLQALVANNLIAEGVKGPEQLLTELIPSVHSGLISGTTLKAEVVEGSGNIVKGFKALSGAGSAYIMKAGDDMFLVCVNNFGYAKVYDVEGKDVTADHADLASAGVAENAKGISASYATELERKIKATHPEATDITVLDSSMNLFNSVVYGVSYKVGEETFYAFTARTHGFAIMDLYYILDTNQAIVKFDAKELIFEEEYFSDFDHSFNPSNYKNGFVGLTLETYDGSQAIINTATMNTNAIKEGTKDIFAAIKCILGGANE